MAREVEERVGNADVAIFAAAVADYRPASEPSAHKRKRRHGDWTVALTENPDVAANAIPLMPKGGVAVGFALETDDLVAHAREKRLRKGFDLVVANPAGEPGAGFGTPTNRVTLIGDGEPEGLPLLSKEEVAERILDRVESLLVKGAGPAAGAGS
jgi:phosphopantothenoylcysteine decarboxylase/phosphopantothenate--cysteine ligase